MPSSPSLPTAGPAPNDKCTSDPSVPLLAASDNVFAGTNTAASTSGADADQVSSRTANRNRSVAAKTTDSPEISTRIPVSMGSVSSRPAATATWPIASANTSAPNAPVSSGSVGNVG